METFAPVICNSYYDRATLRKATLQVRHAILFSALKAAMQQDLINVAGLVLGKARQTNIVRMF